MAHYTRARLQRDRHTRQSIRAKYWAALHRLSRRSATSRFRYTRSQVLRRGVRVLPWTRKKHLEAVQSGNITELNMVKLGTLGAEKLNHLCGKCHRNAEDVAPDQMDMTQRFAAFGVSRSRCFRESNDRLTCIKCHNPHTNVSEDKKRYEQTCLSCHTAKPASFGPSEGGKACPVNPKTGCIPCHMPKRAAGRANSQTTIFASSQKRSWRLPNGLFQQAANQHEAHRAPAPWTYVAPTVVSLQNGAKSQTHICLSDRQQR